MKLLFESWRQYLNEGIDPRIQKQIDMLLAKPNIGIAIASYDDSMETISYVRIEDLEKKEYSELRSHDAYFAKNKRTGIPYGGVDILKAKEHSEGPCLDGWTVVGSMALRGWGPLLYEVAIEYASQNGGGLTSDRIEVSRFAQAVWDKYEKRGGVDARQMDTNHEPGSSGFDTNTLVPQLTPDDKSDDCDQSLPISRRGEDWYKDSTTKMYKKNTPEVMEKLKAAGRLIVV